MATHDDTCTCTDGILCPECAADFELLKTYSDPIAAVAAEWTTAHELVGQPPFQMMAEIVKRNGHMVGVLQYHDALRIRRSAGGHDSYWTASCQGVALQGQWKTRDEAAEAVRSWYERSESNG